MTTLSSGANTELVGATSVTAVLATGSGAADVLALLLDARDHAAGDAVVFYNQTVSADGSVTVDPATSAVSIALDRVPSDVERVLLVAQADGTPHLGTAGTLTVTVTPDRGDAVIVPITPPDFPTVRLAEVYRRGAAWKVRALGDGYADGLPKLLRVHGIEVDDAPAPAPDAAPAPAPVPSSSSIVNGSASGPEPSFPITDHLSPVDEALVPDPALPTLQAAQPLIELWHGLSPQGLQVWAASNHEALEAIAEAESIPQEQFDEARRWAELITSTFNSRFESKKSGKWIPALTAEQPTRDGVAAPDSIAEWISEAEAAMERLTGTAPGLTHNMRVRQVQRLRPILSSVLARRPLAEQAELRRRWSQLIVEGKQRAENVLELRTREFHHILSGAAPIPPVVGWLGDGALDDGVVPGVGPLRVQLGHVVPAPTHITTTRPGDYPGHTSQETLLLDGPQRGLAGRPMQNRRDPRIWGPMGLPLTIDLDVAGGLNTDSPATANNLLLRLLGLLPAGQVRATIYDPDKLGESASFLFGLGDAAETIIGSKVRTTERELSELLGELEEHITFVTQKYLQGTFDSLTDYNVAAGEVAEPYRVLVLYDYPRGFIRADGHVDREALARLAKIVSAGRRCGVFTFAVVPPDAQATAEVWAPLHELPGIFEGQRISSEWFTHLLLGEVSGDLVDRLPDAPHRAEPWHPGYRGTCEGHATGDLADAVANARGARPVFTNAFQQDWVFRADTPAVESTVAGLLASVKRGLVQAEGVKVAPDQVARLARAEIERDVRQGVREHEELPLQSDPSTWWHGSTASGVRADFGRVGASEVASLPLDNGVPGVVIGGRPGSGKSVLLHALIGSWITRYSPDELSLYLVDFKEGVEFKGYATGGLPHAAVIAIESDREFGTSVLRKLVDEISRRGALFKGGSGEDISIADYRRGAAEPLPRIVCVIDEFHVLFERDDRIAAEAGELMEKVVRLGRAFGVHLVLASQTLSGTAGLGRHTLGLLPGRIALQSSEDDSRLLLADDNADARLLSRPGEGILNLRGGVSEANRRFQASFVEVDERTALVAGLRAKADERGHTGRPVVFEGSVPVTVDDLPADAFDLSTTGTLRLPVGLPLTLDGPVFAELRREPGGNALLVADEITASDLLPVLAGTLARNGVPVDVIDYGSMDSTLAVDFERLADGDHATLTKRRGAAERLRAVRDLVTERHERSGYRETPHIVLLSTLHRARDFEIGDEAELLDEITREGPDVGVHVIVWVDKVVSLGRRLSSSTAREFGVRIVGPMSRDDAFSLTESDLPTQITAAQLVLDDHERAVSARVRRLLRPEPTWLAGEAPEPV